MRYVVRGTRESDNWGVPIETFETMDEARVFAASVPDDDYRNVYILTVPTWVDGKPDAQSCRVCGTMAERDVEGRPAAEVFPGPLLCSAACRGEFMDYLLRGGVRRWQ